VTKMDVFPLLRVDNTLEMLAQPQYFFMLDLAAGYWLGRRMDNASQENTAFNTHSGHYEFCGAIWMGFVGQLLMERC